jgi:hypothetical protein
LTEAGYSTKMRRYQGYGLLLQASDWDMVANCWGLSFEYMESFRDGSTITQCIPLLRLEPCTVLRTVCELIDMDSQKYPVLLEARVGGSLSFGEVISHRSCRHDTSSEREKDDWSAPGMSTVLRKYLASQF